MTMADNNSSWLENALNVWRQFRKMLGTAEVFIKRRHSLVQVDRSILAPYHKKLAIKSEQRHRLERQGNITARRKVSRIALYSVWGQKRRPCDGY